MSEDSQYLLTAVVTLLLLTAHLIRQSRAPRPSKPQRLGLPLVVAYLGCFGLLGLASHHLEPGSVHDAGLGGLACLVFSRMSWEMCKHPERSILFRLWGRAPADADCRQVPLVAACFGGALLIAWLVMGSRSGWH